MASAGALELLENTALTFLPTPSHQPNLASEVALVTAPLLKCSEEMQQTENDTVSPLSMLLFPSQQDQRSSNSNHSKNAESTKRSSSNRPSFAAQNATTQSLLSKSTCLPTSITGASQASHTSENTTSSNTEDLVKSSKSQPQQPDQVEVSSIHSVSSVEGENHSENTKYIVSEVQVHSEPVLKHRTAAMPALSGKEHSDAPPSISTAEAKVGLSSSSRPSVEEDPQVITQEPGQGQGQGLMSGEEGCEGEAEGDQTDLTCHTELFGRAQRAAEQAEQFVLNVWKRGWDVIGHHNLPGWMKDNEYLRAGYRPELNSFAACFKSVFRVHTETGNIWTHLLGCVGFITLMIYLVTRPSWEVHLQEKTLISAFFISAILCLGFSCLFHTVSCHSKRIASVFSKLDYCGIAILIIGSKVPFIFYAFYCQIVPKVIYLSLTISLGTGCIVVSLFDKFATPRFRPVRAGMFIAFGLCGVFPGLQVLITYGFMEAFRNYSLGWLLLMAVLYISGAVIYACRVPERLCPGRFDIWLQSHQIFHVFVVAAALVHYHGMIKLVTFKIASNECDSPSTEATLSYYNGLEMTTSTP